MFALKIIINSKEDGSALVKALAISIRIHIVEQGHLGTWGDSVLEFDLFVDLILNQDLQK